LNGADYFWKASVPELKQGYYDDADGGQYTCLVCGKGFEKGVIYSLGEALYSAEKAVALHCRDAHGDMFDFFLAMGKVYTGLTAHQASLLRMFYSGRTDKEIVSMTDATSTSTIRNQRFAFNEKAKQAKIIVALSELLAEKSKRTTVNQPEGLIDIHRTATMIDERYAITYAEKDKILKQYFDADGAVLIPRFPAKEKKKIIILQHIAANFEPNKLYAEPEVNTIIANYYQDIPTIRRYLVQYGFLDRQSDGSTYWLKD